MSKQWVQRTLNATENNVESQFVPLFFGLWDKLNLRLMKRHVFGVSAHRLTEHSSVTITSLREGVLPMSTSTNMSWYYREQVPRWAQQTPATLWNWYTGNSWLINNALVTFRWRTKIKWISRCATFGSWQQNQTTNDPKKNVNFSRQATSTRTRTRILSWSTMSTPFFGAPLAQKSMSLI